MKAASLTIDRLKEVLSFDSETGIFVWKNTFHGIRDGKRAGNVSKKNGYRSIVIDGLDVLAQRLAWFYVNGTWPRLIRFQNSDRDDCRISNLREGYYLSTKHDHRTKEGKASYQKEYRSARREKFNDDARQRAFGITRAQYGDMFLAQDGCCAICRQPETATRNGVLKALAVDHCHETGEIRGLLCVACNTGIGKFKDNRQTMLAAVKYLDKHAGRVAAVPLTVVKSGESA